ncbi:aspartate/glutamate racemase family protein [uncultured Ruegeria sp.]|uniref:aspartate/glutamate racemase family protein n=1 Tax=uncultured Ruegeria sp. TaxID=259304 RepID=UPI00261C415F|nr:aspartate/glutamate racemase family protein [uncultured Ruegeria sp.]
MHIHIVNPNSSANMTDLIGKVAERCKSPGTSVDVTRAAMAPVSIEGYTDEAISVPLMLREINAAEQRGAQAHVVACFDDPGIAAAREVASMPVVGICEAAVKVALLLSNRFSVVTTLPRSVPIIEDLVVSYGAGRHCRRVRSIDMPVLSLEENGEKTAQLLKTEILAARHEDRAEAIILGCAGMTDLCESLTEETGILVIDGVTAAIRLAEAVVGMGYRTSKVGSYAAPLSKVGGFKQKAI